MKVHKDWLCCKYVIPAESEGKVFCKFMRMSPNRTEKQWGKSGEQIALRFVFTRKPTFAKPKTFKGT